MPESGSEITQFTKDSIHSTKMFSDWYPWVSSPKFVDETRYLLLNGFIFHLLTGNSGIHSWKQGRFLFVCFSFMLTCCICANWARIFWVLYTRRSQGRHILFYFFEWLPNEIKNKNKHPVAVLMKGIGHFGGDRKKIFNGQERQLPRGKNFNFRALGFRLLFFFYRNRFYNV